MTARQLTVAASALLTAGLTLATAALAGTWWGYGWALVPLGLLWATGTLLFPLRTHPTGPGHPGPDPHPNPSGPGPRTA